MLAIVVYLIGSWEGFHRRPMLQALARNLRGRGFLLVVEPPVPLLDSRHLRDWRPAARAVVRPTEQVTENIILVRPRTTFREAGAKVAYARAIKAALRQAAPPADRVAAFIYRPDQSWLLGAAEEDSVVYECYDEYRVDMTGQPRPEVPEAERELMASSRIVLTTSHPLHASRSAEHPRVYYTPNGMEFACFSRAADPELTIPEALCERSAPLVGYLGNFTAFLDTDCIEQTITTAPDLRFAFVGPVTARETADRIGALPNVRFLGLVKYRGDLPAYLKGMDVSMCMLRGSQYTEAMLPLTLLEYMAAGKPTVFRPSGSVVDFDDLLYFANSADEAVAQIHRALAEDSPELVAARQARAREYDWDVLTKRTAEIILDSCA